MSLDNLVRIHQLQHHTADPAAVRRLMMAIERNLADSLVPGISNETRFDAAYKAIMQCAMLGLWANGYRPATSTPGHHQTMIQTLTTTLDLERQRWLVLDALRKKRNLSDYSGDPIEPEATRECISEAQALHRHLSAWLQDRRPELLGPSGPSRA